MLAWRYSIIPCSPDWAQGVMCRGSTRPTEASDSMCGAPREKFTIDNQILANRLSNESPCFGHFDPLDSTLASRSNCSGYSQNVTKPSQSSRQLNTPTRIAAIEYTIIKHCNPTHHVQSRARTQTEALPDLLCDLQARIRGTSPHVVGGKSVTAR